MNGHWCIFSLHLATPQTQIAAAPQLSLSQTHGRLTAISAHTLYPTTVAVPIHNHAVPSSVLFLPPPTLPIRALFLSFSIRYLTSPHPASSLGSGSIRLPCFGAAEGVDTRENRAGA